MAKINLTYDVSKINRAIYMAGMDFFCAVGQLE